MPSSNNIAKKNNYGGSIGVISSLKCGLSQYNNLHKIYQSTHFMYKGDDKLTLSKK
jgi:hypothetical protein